MTDPIAQGPNAEGTPASETPSQENQPNAGFQKRIDELVAKHADAQRRAEELSIINTQQMQMLMNQAVPQVQSQGPQPGELPPELLQQVDPTLLKVIEAMTAKQSAQFQQVIARLEGQQAQQAFQQRAASLPPEVVANGQKLMNDWRRAGLQGWTPEDALTYAMGQIYQKALATKGQNRDALGRFNAASQGDQIIEQGASGGGVPESGVQPQPQSQIPQYADQSHPSYNPEKAAAFYEKRMNGKF